MKIILTTIALALISITQVFAHEGEAEITNLAEAEWAGPLVTILVIVATVILARIIRKG